MLWQVFLGAIQLAIVGGTLWLDYDMHGYLKNPVPALLIGGATAFLLTHILNLAATWLTKRRAQTLQKSEDASVGRLPGGDLTGKL